MNRVSGGKRSWVSCTSAHAPAFALASARGRRSRGGPRGDAGEVFNIPVISPHSAQTVPWRLGSSYAREQGIA